MNPLPDAARAPAERMDVSLVLRAGALAHLEELGAALLRGERPREVGDRSLFASRFAPSRAAVDRVRRFAAERGFEVAALSRLHRIAVLRGRAVDLAAAFAGDGGLQAHGGPSRGAHGCRELREVVDAVLGFEDPPGVLPCSSPACALRDRPYNPRQVAKAYRFPRGTGSGQTLAIIALDGPPDRRDVEAYFHRLRIKATPRIATVAVLGAAATSRSRSNRSEVMLDVEIAAAIAPEARIVVYHAPNTIRGFVHALKAAVYDGRRSPAVISISWGKAESRWPVQALQAVHSTLRDAAVLGITVLCATGNLGSSDGIDDGRAHVDFPASSPFALACGGSCLQLGGDGVLDETAWSLSGGGISEAFPVPAFQRSCRLPASVNPGNFAGRGVPDVAGHASFAQGYWVRVDGEDTVMGGTSAVAPLYAALFAIINQRIGRAVGFVNPLLYGHRHASTGCRDIVRGGNGAYRAGCGWDACTGLGSVDGAALLRAIRVSRLAEI